MKIQNQRTVILNELEKQISQRLIHSRIEGLVQLLDDADCANLFSILNRSRIYFELRLTLVMNGFTNMRIEKIDNLARQLCEDSGDVDLQFLRAISKAFEIISRDFNSQIKSITAYSKSEKDGFLEEAKKASHVFENEFANFNDSKKKIEDLHNIIKTKDLTKFENLFPFAKKLLLTFNSVPPFELHTFCDENLPNIPLKMLLNLLSTMDPKGYEPVINQFINISGNLYREKVITLNDYKCRLICSYGCLVLYSDVNRCVFRAMAATDSGGMAATHSDLMTATYFGA